MVVGGREEAFVDGKDGSVLVLDWGRNLGCHDHDVMGIVLVRLMMVW